MAKIPSHPFTFRIVLLIAGIIAIPLLAVVALQSTDNRSKASFNGLQQCLSRCSPGIVAMRWFSDKSAQCKLDCQKVVVAKTMTCSEFCSRNSTNRSDSQGENNQGRYANSCVTQCQTWSDTKPCGGADGTQCSLGACPPGAACKLQSGVCKNHVCVSENTSTDGVCSGEGSSCTIEKCMGYECPPGRNCPAMPRQCTKRSGICTNSRCVVTDIRPSGRVIQPSCRLADSEKTDVTYTNCRADGLCIKMTCVNKVVNCSGTTNCTSEIARKGE